MSVQTARIACFREALDAFRGEFDGWLRGWLERRADFCRQSSPDLEVLAAVLMDFSLRPGKRLRPFLVLWGSRAVRRMPDEQILPVAAAAEMLHVFALAHDDVMDCSDTRRGLPTVHRLFESFHAERSLRGSAAQFGLSGAILLGDYALALSDELIDSSPLPDGRRRALREVWDRMREEVILGQFMDVAASCSSVPAPEDTIHRILSLKSGKYTLERPLHLGAAAAGGDPELQALFSRYGEPLGRAFQIQDDILGMFGSPQVTGKPADSDIREGKSTLLISRAFQSASPSDREAILAAWGHPGASAERLERVREIVRATGALDAARAAARRAADEATAALEGSSLPVEVREVLLGLAEFVLDREA
jgi:geranylgeranyl diphosphate synthase type I